MFANLGTETIEIQVTFSLTDTKNSLFLSVYYKHRLTAFAVVNNQKYRDTVNLLSCPT